MNFSSIPESQFYNDYVPVVNHIDDNASFSDGNGGIMFETYGDEFDYILSVCNNEVDGLSALNVWTIVQGESPDFDSAEGSRLLSLGCTYSDDDNDWVSPDGEPMGFTVFTSGFHIVNREGYIITSNPFVDNEFIEVILD